MHVAYLTEDYIHQDEPWYLSILCVWVTCKVHVHKSGKPGDNCTQVICHFSWKGGKYLQETIPLGFHHSVASSFRTLGWSSSGPKALEGSKPLRSLVTPSLETTISSMKGADLSRSGTWVRSFLLNTPVNWPWIPLPFRDPTMQPHFLSSFSGVEYLWCLFSDYWCTCTHRSLWGLP